MELYFLRTRKTSIFDDGHQTRNRFSGRIAARFNYTLGKNCLPNLVAMTSIRRLPALDIDIGTALRRDGTSREFVNLVK